MSGREIESQGLALPRIQPDVKRRMDRATAVHVADQVAARHSDLPGRRIAHDPTARADVLELLDAIGLLPHPQGARMPTTLSKTDIADVAEKAAQIIKANGLHQGYLYDEEQAKTGLPLSKCRVDLVGAVNIAVFGKPRWPAEEHAGSPLAQAVVLAVEETVKKPVPAWNDAHGRTAEDAIEALEATAVRLWETA